jgi:hypothetical protein
MLKLKKFALIGLALAVVGAMLPGCTEADDPEPETYTLTLGSGVTATFEGTPYTGSVPFLYKGDVVDISASSTDGKAFAVWSATPNASGSFGSSSNKNTTFKMPGFNVKIDARFDGTANIRFTWSQSRNSMLEYVEASTEMIQWWITNVWPDPDLDPEDFSMPNLPRATGNPSITGSIFKKGGTTNNYDVWYKSNPGTYLAVMSINDAALDNIWEVMAVYDIEIEEGDVAGDGRDAYFDLGFDIDGWLDAETDEGYLYTVGYDQSGKNRRTLFKARTLQKKQVRAGGTMTVTYYAFPRART